MTYYIATTLNLPFEEVIAATEAALQNEGFGVLTRIDMEKTLREKIGVEFRPYTILGACNPKLANEALQIEDKIGTMLPCNVVVQHKGDSEIEVAAVDPVASMQAVGNPDLTKAAHKVRDLLQNVIDDLAGN